MVHDGLDTRIKIFYRHSKEECRLLLESDPDRTQFPHLPHPLFTTELERRRRGWGGTRIDGFIPDKQVIRHTMSGSGVGHAFQLV